MTSVIDENERPFLRTFTCMDFLCSSKIDDSQNATRTLFLLANDLNRNCSRRILTVRCIVFSLKYTEFWLPPFSKLSSTCKSPKVRVEFIIGFQAKVGQKRDTYLSLVYMYIPIPYSETVHIRHACWLRCSRPQYVSESLSSSSSSSSLQSLLQPLKKWGGGHAKDSDHFSSTRFKKKKHTLSLEYPCRSRERIRHYLESPE